MKCPNCGMSMKRSFCVHCGYMTNGIIINTKKKIEIPLLELYFGKSHDKIVRNENWLVTGLLGPTYLMSHNFFLVGFLLFIIDSIVSLFFLTINHALLFYYIVVLSSFIYWFFNRLTWATIGNIIYIQLLSKRLVKFRKKHPDDYKMKIQELYKKDKRLTVFKYIFFGLLTYIIFNYVKVMFYQYLHLM